MKTKPAPHDLVIGGSGMLSAMCERLAMEGRTISVVARNSDRLNHLVTRIKPGTGRIVPVPVDYRNAPALRRALDALIAEHGRPIRTACYVHEEIAPEAPLQVAEYTGKTFWHILGSVQPNFSQADLLAHWRDRFNHAHASLDYRQITLGFVTDRQGPSRWLTDGEISQGVEAALKTNEFSTIIGTITPWSLRP